MITLRGTCSTFGGPSDDPSAGNARPDWRTEGLAMFPASEAIPPSCRSLFLPTERITALEAGGLTGRARHLDPDRHYLALRLDDDPLRPGIQLDRGWWRQQLITLRAVSTGRAACGRVVDWGPAESTGRLVDLSPGLARILGVSTGAEVEVLLPELGERAATTAAPDPLPDEAYQPIDPRDGPAPGQGWGAWRSTGHEGRTSVLGRLLGPIGIALIGATLAGGSAGPVLARLRELVPGGLMRSLMGILSGPSPGAGDSDPMGSILSKLIAQLLGVVTGVERDAPGTPGPGKHSIAVAILERMGVSRDLADDLVPIAVALLNTSAIGHRWATAIEAAGSSQALLRRILGDTP